MGAVKIIIATLILLLVICAVVLPYLLIIRMLKYNQMFVTFRTPRVLISEIYSELCTGDIILFVSTVHTLTNSSLTQTFYSHSGMLMREGDLIYITEAQPGIELMPNFNKPGTEQYMSPGAGISPLLVRVKYYTGDIYIMKLSRRLDDWRDSAVKAIGDKLNNEKYPYPSAAAAILSIIGYKSKTRHCFQHVAHILDEIGLTPIDHKGKFADAGFLKISDYVSNLTGRPLPDGYEYLPPVQLMYDIN